MGTTRSAAVREVKESAVTMLCEMPSSRQQQQQGLVPQRRAGSFSRGRTGGQQMSLFHTGLADLTLPWT